MKKRTIFCCITALYSMATFAAIQTEPSIGAPQRVGLFQHDDLRLGTQKMQSTSLGMIANSNTISLTGLYTRRHFNNPLMFAYPQTYHTLDMLLDGKHDRYQYLGIFKSESDQPVTESLFYQN